MSRSCVRLRRPRWRGRPARREQRSHREVRDPDPLQPPAVGAPDRGARRARRCPPSSDTPTTRLRGRAHRAHAPASSSAARRSPTRRRARLYRWERRAAASPTARTRRRRSTSPASSSSTSRARSGPRRSCGTSRARRDRRAAADDEGGPGRPVTSTVARPRARTCGGARRRTSSPRCSGGTATSTAREDAVQEALLAAARQWPAEGVPDDPRGWLITVASRRLVDQLRGDRPGRRARRARRARSADACLAPAADGRASGDDTLRCCCCAATRRCAARRRSRSPCAPSPGSPPRRSRRAFLVPEPTMAQRISRAKARLRAAGAPFVVPAAAELPGPGRGGRWRCCYLVFNEGYTASAGRGPPPTRP